LKTELFKDVERRKFIKSLGKGTAFLSGAGLYLSCKISNEDDHRRQLKKMSNLAFKRFEEVWDYNDFWKRGNTFDACLNFVLALQKKWPNDKEVSSIQHSVKKMLEKNLEFFYSFDPGSLWADDFGWWGIMALNARKFLKTIGEKELADDYLKLSIDLCWEYKKNTAYDHTSDAKPVPHGCRNGDANGQSDGVKNTVTNVLLFLLSSRIYRVTLEENIQDNEKYLDLAWRQWCWFDQWFRMKEYEYLKMITSESGLVQERPMAFFDGSGYTNKTHPTWCEGWMWSGDQGMLLQALTDMLALADELEDWLSDKELDPEFDKKKFELRIREFIQIIGWGVKTALVGKTDDIFREAPFKCSFGPEHGRDYMAGRGILMRYLGNKEVQELLKVDFNEAISATLEALWKTRDKANNQFQSKFTSAENDAVYIKRFEEIWGVADDVQVWETPYEKEKQMVSQSIGLDALGSALKVI
jgi:hypothetical protein